MSKGSSKDFQPSFSVWLKRIPKDWGGYSTVIGQKGEHVDNKAKKGELREEKGGNEGKNRRKSRKKARENRRKMRKDRKNEGKKG